MRRALQFAALVLIATATAAHAQFHLPGTGKDKPAKVHRGTLEWLWQYGPSDTDKEGRENALVQDDRFRPMLAQYLTAPQTFWGNAVSGKYRSLADTALDFLSVPDKVLADDNRYLSISGCVVHFCPSRGLLWVDLNARDPLLVFAAIDWIRDSKTTTQPDAEYTLWIFPNQTLVAEATAPNRISPALTHSIARWSAQPLAGTGIVQNITHAILVDPDGTPHELPIAAVGVTTPKAIIEKKDAQ
ncbi:hypothetical protein [Granulicella arctica]|uniref:Uncharacterized protein n=1 Tax=Granulicella arctica TaxID=940613 RepID=A0A7Y9TIN4_9BACT|nr:hypothetical protein [Granulicella arctica]NYF81220.1 hypothetical protein [Granulicella arctica]